MLLSLLELIVLLDLILNVGSHELMNTCKNCLQIVAAEVVIVGTEVVASEGVEDSAGETAGETAAMEEEVEDLEGVTKWEEGWWSFFFSSNVSTISCVR